MPFAQLVLGAPGAGKSTFCDGMQQFLTAVGRPAQVVNLDPANDAPAYAAALDVRDLIPLEDVMAAEELGPNGGVLFAAEELEHNFDWLEAGLRALGDDYILFDCPGQVELFTHHGALRNIFLRLQRLGYRLVVLHLTDAHALTRPSLYVSALLQALRAMLQMDLPHLNVLTKIDTLANYPPLPFNLDFYTDVQDLDHLLPHLDAEMAGGHAPPRRRKDTDVGSDDAQEDEEEDDERPPHKFAALNRAMIDLVSSFGLLGFQPVAVEDRTTMAALLRAVDRAGGYAFAPGGEGASEAVWSVAMREDDVVMDVRDVQERWVDRREEWDEIERRGWEEEGKAAAEAAGGGVREEEQGARSGGGSVHNGQGVETGRGMLGRDAGIKIVRWGG